MTSYRIVCIGAGRLAHHLMPALQEAGHQVIQVWNRTLTSAAILADKLKTISFTNTPSDLVTDADFYFIATSDDAVVSHAQWVREIAGNDAAIIHSSGVLPLTVLPPGLRGVFYPLQTFSPNVPVDWTSVPVLITSDDSHLEKKLVEIAAGISQRIVQISDQQKAILHISAVFANNFTNHLLTIAEKICADSGIDFRILHPLMKQTFEKAISQGPSLSQTGPAMRGDQHTIEQHLAWLKKHHPQWASIYQEMSTSISG